MSGNFTGFVQDNFWAVEVQAPDGYNLVDGPIKITIDASALEINRRTGQTDSTQ